MLVEVVPVTYARTTISTRMGSHSMHWSTFGSGTLIMWFGATSRVVLEPVGGQAVQDLPLERDGPEHRVERADAVGDDDEPLAVAGVVVADLPLVLGAEAREVRFCQRVGERLPEHVVGDHRSPSIAQSVREVTRRPRSRAPALG